MSRFEEYVQRLCRNGKYTPEEARESALSREVKKYYESDSKTEPSLRHEFTCCSES